MGLHFFLLKQFVFGNILDEKYFPMFGYVNVNYLKILIWCLMCGKISAKKEKKELISGGVPLLTGLTSFEKVERKIK